MIGVVRMISSEKRFGFIKSGDDDYFFHASEYQGHWDDLVTDYHSGQKVEVEFDPQEAPKGLRAGQVSRVDWPNAAAREYNG